MKKIHLAVTAQPSTFFVQDALFLFLILLITLIAPFFTGHGLRYDLFSSVVFFSFFNNVRLAPLWLTCFAFYIDTVMALPFGSTSMFVLILWLMNQLLQRFLKKRTFMIHWFSFSALYLIAIAGRLMISDLFFHLPCKLLTEAYSYILTIFCYPILCRFLADIFRYFKLKSR